MNSAEFLDFANVNVGVVQPDKCRNADRWVESGPFLDFAIFHFIFQVYINGGDAG